MAGEIANNLSRLKVPELKRAVHRAGKGALAAPYEANAAHTGRMTGQNLNRLSRLGVPEPHGLVEAARENAAAVARKGCTDHVPGVTGQSQQRLSAGQIPDPDAFFISRGQKMTTIGSKRDSVIHSILGV